MRVVIEVEGPAYRCTAATLLCAVLLGAERGGALGEIGHEVVPATSYFLEWLGDRIDEEGSSASADALHDVQRAAERFIGLVEQEIGRQLASEPSRPLHLPPRQ